MSAVKTPAAKTAGAAATAVIGEPANRTNFPVNGAGAAVAAVIGEPAKRTNLPVWEGLKSSKIAALAWTAMRVWLGVMWIQAGSAKIWGAEAAGFLHNNGAGVAGFAAHGTPAYSWWGSFLHGFVVPNAGALGVLITVAEFAIGVALVAGLFTRVAALGSLALLFTYVMSGTASVCAFYAAIAIVILVMWRTSSWIGIDGLIAGYRQRHQNLFTAHSTVLSGPGLTADRDDLASAGRSFAPGAGTAVASGPCADADGPPGRPVALGSCRLVAEGAAELGLLVEDAWQRQGTGTRLLRDLVAYADGIGVRLLEAQLLADQSWITSLLRPYGPCRVRSSRHGVMTVTVRR